MELRFLTEEKGKGRQRSVRSESDSSAGASSVDSQQLSQRRRRSPRGASSPPSPPRRTRRVKNQPIIASSVSHTTISSLDIDQWLINHGQEHLAEWQRVESASRLKAAGHAKAVK